MSSREFSQSQEETLPISLKPTPVITSATPPAKPPRPLLQAQLERAATAAQSRRRLKPQLSSAQLSVSSVSLTSARQCRRNSSPAAPVLQPTSGPKSCNRHLCGDNWITTSSGGGDSVSGLAYASGGSTTGRRMSSWGERMASVVTACGPRSSSSGMPYHRRIEKVKFGVPLDQVCKKEIPGPLLVMLLKLNKEGPFKKDVFRAPGHQGNMRKLIHFLQNGRLVNIHSFSVNTIASVLKKFLRKIPGGIFGAENEAELFNIIKTENPEEKLAKVQSEEAKTGMTAEALGVSVAPSFFHTCVAAGKTAKMEDVERFKLATKVTTFFIEHFGIRALFGRENYEYYARLTGRILKIEDEWIFFTYPPVIYGSSGLKGSGGPPVPGPSGASRDDMDASLNLLGVPKESEHSALEKTGSLEIIPENCPLDPKGRLSISLDDQNVSSPSSCGSPQGVGSCTAGLGIAELRTQTLGRAVAMSGSRNNRGSKKSGIQTSASDVLGLKSIQGAQDIKSYSCLPQVHQRQTERMKHRSEWFLSDPTGLVTVKCKQQSLDSKVSSASTTPLSLQQGAMLIKQTPVPSSNTKPPFHVFSSSPVACDTSKVPPTSSTSTSSLPPPPTRGGSQTPLISTAIQGSVSLRRRLSDKDRERRLVRRSSSKRKDKENGGKEGNNQNAGPTPGVSGSSNGVSGSAVGGGVSANVGNASIEELSTGLQLQTLPCVVSHSSAALMEGDSGSQGRPNLQRTSSADGGGGGMAPSRHLHHPALCRTGSQDTPHQSAPPQSPLLKHSGSESPLTRSLPRI